MEALAKTKASFSNLSDSQDTKTLVRLLKSEESILDTGPAGTTYRFLCAYLAIKEGEHILTGSDRMKKRPIQPLVEALRSLGAEIEYLEEEGYPPLKIQGAFKQLKKVVKIDVSQSSQFVSALCLIGPALEKGIVIEWEAEIVSRSYLDMTLSLMKEMGIKINENKNSIEVPPQEYKVKDLTVESDWSSASYFYSIAALTIKPEITLENFFQKSIQGDSRLPLIFERIGVKSQFDSGKLTLTKNESFHPANLDIDFSSTPDIFQTIAVMSAALDIEFTFSGVTQLKYKESDRVSSLYKELAKLGIKHQELSIGSSTYLQTGRITKDDCNFDTYDDHRMAMCLAPLALLRPVTIIDPEVVSKSYPNYWEDLKKLGFQVEPIG